MALVSGPLSTVTTEPSAVSQVNISINSPRTRGTGVMTPEVKTVAVTGGVFSSQIAPGPAVLTLLIGVRKSVPIPILVDDVPSQTLANAVNAAKVATSGNQEWLEKLAAEVIAGTQGPMGEPGPQGPAGTTPEMSIGTVTTVDSGQPAEATMVLVDENQYSLNLSIPRGHTGNIDQVDEAVEYALTEIAYPAITTARDSALAQVEASMDDAGIARVVQGKNLYNPDSDLVDFYLFGTGQPQTLINYRLTDFIPVSPGESYAMNVARHWAFFDADRNMVPESWAQNSVQQSTVITAPTGAAYLRMSYAVGAWNPTNVQIEHGTTSTAWEPYQRRLDPTIVVSAEGAQLAPLHVARSGDVVTATSDLGGKPIAQEITLSMGRNGVLNFSRVTYNNALVATLNDDVAPIRTQQGTVGANHGLALMARWPAGSHDKTTADIGSIWTDGVSEFTIIDVDPTGKLFAGKAPAVVSGAATAPNSTPAGDLSHVSGATNTATIPRAGHAVTDQVAPWVQRKRQVVELDGVPLADGEARGHVLTMRESYEILDYGVIHTWVRANPGQRYTTTHHKAAVGVETEWRFSPGGKTRHHTALWEISPTTLGNIGFMQAIALPGDVTRYLPGVGVVGGLNWDTGVDLSLLTSNLKVNAGDLLDGRPPTMAVDIRSDLGMAIALTPWEGASESSTHLASTPANLFDLRSTKKMYPNIIGSIPPGWGRITATGIRAYLTPTEAEAIVADADPVSAWVTLDQMSG